MISDARPWLGLEAPGNFFGFLGLLPPFPFQFLGWPGSFTPLALSRIRRIGSRRKCHVQVLIYLDPIARAAVSRFRSTDRPDLPLLSPPFISCPATPPFDQSRSILFTLRSRSFVRASFPSWPGCSVIYGFGSCSHRGGVMTGRSASSYHLRRFPLSASHLLTVATFDLTNP